MIVICADPCIFSLFNLERKVTEILPDASVHLCRKAETALEMARQKGCDVLITEIDFGRDKGEGIWMAEKIRDSIPNVNIIFVTADSFRDYAELILKMKISGFLTKPYKVEELKKELLELRFQ